MPLFPHPDARRGVAPPRRPWPIVGVGLLALLLAALLGLVVGPGEWSLSALLSPADDYAALVLREVRAPRVVVGVVAGAAFAVAGCVLQSMSRNALAAPSLVGVQPGASLGVVCGLTVLPDASQATLAQLAFAGAALGVGATFAIAATVRRAPRGLALLLAGMAVGMTLGALSTWLVLSQSIGRDLLMWQAGSLAHARWPVLAAMAPVWGVGFVLAALLAAPLRVLALGDDAARSLGGRPLLVRALGTLVVLLLAGATVAVVGPLSFLGLLVPHMARALVGLDERKVLPVAALLGAVLLVLADAAARSFQPPRETPVGVLLMAAGATFFLLQLRRRGARRFSLSGGGDG